MRLVFIHGRSQEHKDAATLKKTWLDALTFGLKKTNRKLPISEGDIVFPYYGDTLYQLVEGRTEAEAAPVILRGGGASDEERQFMSEIVGDVITESGIPDVQRNRIMGTEAVERGPQDWPWVHAGLRVIDEFISPVAATTLAVVTHDVYLYLTHTGIRDAIEGGIRAAFAPGVPTVVVGHSLGTVVAYNLLRREGKAAGWQVPLLVTIGSPLGINAIKRKMTPLKYPECADKWLNVRDKRDIVALYPLDGAHFPVLKDVENLGDVDNHTENRHGIEGYLDDETVAARIHAVLVGGAVPTSDQ